MLFLSLVCVNNFNCIIWTSVTFRIHIFNITIYVAMGYNSAKVCCIFKGTLNWLTNFWYTKEPCISIQELQVKFQKLISGWKIQKKAQISCYISFLILDMINRQRFLNLAMEIGLRFQIVSLETGQCFQSWHCPVPRTRFGNVALFLWTRFGSIALFPLPVYHVNN